MRAVTECPREALMTEPDGTLDLDAYLQRIGYAGSRAPSRATLDALHLAHATHIPFENLDILLGRPIRLDLASLQAKLVAGRRGGYCFEQNRLFAAALEALGYAVTPLAARVRFGATSILPRTHMTLQVEVDGSRVLADVGFGVFGLLLPVSLGKPASRDSSRGRIASPMTKGCACCNCATARPGPTSMRSRSSGTSPPTTRWRTTTRRRTRRRGSSRC